MVIKFGSACPGKAAIGKGILFIAAFWFSFSSLASAQPYHELTINDFRGAPPANRGDNIANTDCTIEYSYIPSIARGYYRLQFTINLVLNKDDSWLDRRKINSPEMLAEILKHEQGHYILAYLEQQELLRTVGKTVFYADFRSQAKNILHRIDAKYKRMNQDYDDGTQHMLNREQQHSWDVFFTKQLEYMPGLAKRHTRYTPQSFASR